MGKMLPLLVALGGATACGGEPLGQGAATDEEPAASPIPAGHRRGSLTIEGMVCGSCAQAAQDALEGVPGVASAETDFPTGTAVAVYDPAATDLDALAAQIEAVDRGEAPPFQVVSQTLLDAAP